MDGFAIVEESDNALTRTLDFGKFKVNDRVDFVPMEKLHFHIPAQGEIMESRLEIAIEEPFPDRFFLRFIYEDSAAEEGPEAMYNDFRPFRLQGNGCRFDATHSPVCVSGSS